MSNICYYCTECCDGKPCIVIYPEDETPIPKRCLISSAPAEWKPIVVGLDINKFVKEVFARIPIEEADSDV
jgi:hypothetical protein